MGLSDWIPSPSGIWQRHKWKLSIMGILGGGSWIGMRLLEKKILEMEEQAHREQKALVRRQVAFETNEQDGNITVQRLLPEMLSTLKRELDGDQVIQKLKRVMREVKAAKGTELEAEKKKEYHELWEEVKVVVFTELLASVYTLSLLVVFLRVQLNVLGGYLLLRALELEGGQQDLSGETQKGYMALAQFLKTDGVNDLVRKLQPKIAEVLKDSSALKTKLSRADLGKNFSSIRLSFEDSSAGSDKNCRFSEYVLPSQLAAATESVMEFQGSERTLEVLVGETRDVLDWPLFTDALNACVSTCLKHIDDTLAINCFEAESGGDEPTFLIAKLVPMLHQQAFAVFDPEVGPVKGLLELPEVTELSSRVFDSFCEPVEVAVAPPLGSTDALAGLSNTASSWAASLGTAIKRSFQ